MNARSDVVAVIQPFVPSYRKPLFDAVDVELRRHGLRLEVWHDFPKGRVAARGNADSGSWSVPIKQRRLSVGRRNVTFRNVLGRAREVRAIVAGLASTNIETYALALDPKVRLMLWGHGRNFTASNNSIDLQVEAWLARRSSHVFTYTEDGKKHVVSRGTSEDKVTVVVNATDTSTLKSELEKSGATSSQLRAKYGLGAGPVLLFIGAFDAPKQLPFLFDSMDRVVAHHPDAQLVLAGAGPDEPLVSSRVRARAYAHQIGRLDPAHLAAFSKIVDAIVMPGRVGLVAVDALALGIPVVTTTYPYHAPEAAYLTDGQDSLWTRFEVDSFADGLVSLLSQPERLALLSRQAREKGEDFSVQRSAERFVTGVLKGLDQE